MNRRLLLIGFVAVLSISLVGLYLQERQLRADRLQKLSDDEWCKRKIAEAFPSCSGYIVLENVTSTAEARRMGVRPNYGELVVWISGKNPEFFRWFISFIYEPDPIQYDPNNHFYPGFITSDLELYNLPLDTFLQ